MSLKGLRAAILAGPEFEDLELFYPYYRLKEEGIEVHVIAPEKKPYYGKHGLEVKPDKSILEANPKDYNILVIPGGWAPDRLRRDPRVVEFVREVALNNAIIATITSNSINVKPLDLRSIPLSIITFLSPFK